MPDIISIILLISFLCFISGLFSPESVLIFRKKASQSRATVVKTYGLSTILLFVLYTLSGTMQTVEEDYVIPNIPSKEIKVDFENDGLAVIGEVADNQKIQIQVNDVVNLDKDALYKPKDGYHFIQVEVSIKNISTDVVGYNQFQFKIINEADQVAVPVFSTVNSQTALNLGDLLHDEVVTGTIVFEVPVESTSIALYYDVSEPLVFNLGSSLDEFERLDDVEEIIVDERILIGDIIESDSFAIQVLEISKMDSVNFMKPKALNEFVEVLIAIKNVSPTTQAVYPYAFKVENSLGSSSTSLTTHPNEEVALQMRELGPGGCMIGSLIFEQPKDDESLSLIFTHGVGANQQKLKVSLADTRETFETLTSDEDLARNQEVINSGESGLLHSTEIILNGVTNILDSIYQEPKENHEYIVVDLTMINHGNNELSYNLYDFKLLNQKGEMVNPIIPILDTDEALKTGKLPSTEKTTGVVVFEQPLENENYYLIYSPINVLSTEILMYNLTGPNTEVMDDVEQPTEDLEEPVTE